MKKPLRVFVGTNILFSGLFFKGAPAKLLRLAEEGKVKLVVGEYIVEESIEVVKSKVPEGLYELSKFLASATYEQTKLPSLAMVKRYSYALPDIEDAAVLASAIIADVDYFVSGDKDFQTEEIKKLVNLVTCQEILKILGGY
jgi:putative PIN family toxin of toxin-antitoxin system